MTWEEQKPNTESLTLKDLPDNWDGFTKEGKVQKKLDVIQEQMASVRKGTFDISKGDRVAALILETQLDLSIFMSDEEARAKSSKHIAEFIEAEVGNDIVKNSEKKPNEATIKRESLVSDKVKDARATIIDNEKSYKKWRCVYDILREAHIMFRNISRL